MDHKRRNARRGARRRGESDSVSRAMTRAAAFYFANLGADVARCASAARRGDEARYADSLSRAYRTLEQLRRTARPEAYEEGLLMLRGLAFARATPEALASFQSSLDALIGAFSARLVA